MTIVQQTHLKPLGLRSSALILFAAPLLSVNGFAETSSNGAIEQITVTAHRTAITAVPQVRVIDRDNLDERGRSVGPDALATLPGLAISRSGAFGSQTQIRVRGSEANHLQVLVDGIEVNDPAIGSEYNFGNLNLAGVERIEFAPGAQSALWGSDAVSGVLNLITTPTQQRRELAVTGGSFNTWQAQGQLADRYESGYYSLSGSFYDTDGTNNALTGSEEDGFTSTNLHFSQGFTGEVISTALVLRYNDNEFDTDPAPFPISVPVDGDQRTDHREVAAKLEVSAQLLDGRWQPSLSLTYLDTNNDNRVDGQIIDQVNGERLRLSWKNHWQINDSQLLTAIIEREEEEFEQTGSVSFFGDPNQTQDGATNSISVEHVGRWGNWQTAISARFDSNDDFANSVSYRLAARYQIADAWQAFGSVATGTKNPSFFERFGFTPATFVGNSSLDPETNAQLSVGLRFQNALGQAEITLFADQLQDEINGFVATATPGIFTATNINDDSDRRGLELQASTRIGAFDLSGSYTYLDSEDPNGQTELRRPEHSGHLQLGYGFAAERGYLQIGSIFTGEQLDTDFRTFTQVALDNYSRVHLSARYALSDNVVIKARVENALDDDNEDVFMFRAPERAAFVTLQVQL